METQHGSRRTVGTLLLAAAVVLLSHAAAAGEGDEEHLRRIGHILSTERQGQHDPRVELSRDLARLGPQGIPALLDTLESGRVPGALDDKLEPVPLEKPQQEALYLALSSFGPQTLAPHLEQALRQRPGKTRRLIVLGLLERIGTAGQLGLAALAASADQARTPIDQAVRTALEGAVESILRRDARGYDRIEALVDAAAPDLAAALVTGATSTDSPRALQLAAGLLGWDSRRDLLLLGRIASLAPRLPRPLDEDVLGDTRAYLRAEDAQLVRAAALACGHLEDCDAMARLVELLDQEDAGVRDAAHWSLQHLAGVRLPAQSQHWRAWLRGQEQWLAREAPSLIADLHGQDAARTVHALHELAGQRYRRDRIAGEMVFALEHGWPEVRRTACAALGRLGSRAVVQDLAQCLADPSPAVAAEAWAALKQLTGADLPAQAEAWTQAFPSR